MVLCFVRQVMKQCVKCTADQAYLLALKETLSYGFFELIDEQTRAGFFTNEVVCDMHAVLCMLLRLGEG
jgi:hypothetical protein